MLFTTLFVVSLVGQISLWRKQPGIDNTIYYESLVRSYTVQEIKLQKYENYHSSAGSPQCWWSISQLLSKYNHVLAWIVVDCQVITSNHPMDSLTAIVYMPLDKQFSTSRTKEWEERGYMDVVAMVARRAMSYDQLCWSGRSLYPTIDHALAATSCESWTHFNFPLHFSYCQLQLSRDVVLLAPHRR